MRERDLFRAIGEVDAALVAQAARPPRRHRAVKGWLMATAAAAAIALLVGGAWVYRLAQSGTPATEPVTPAASETGNLPLLANDPNLNNTGDIAASGLVFANSPTELQPVNVWTETPATLPVWQVNNAQAEDYAWQAAALRRCAARLGETLDETQITSLSTGEEGTTLATFANSERHHYGIEADHTYVAVSLQQPLTLGAETEWLAQVQARYPHLLADMERPTLRFWGGQRAWYAEDGHTMAATEPYYNAQIYDAAAATEGDAAFLTGIQLWMEEGELKQIYFYLPEMCEKLGDYPLLTASEARERLAQMAAADSEVAADYQVVSEELVYNADSISDLRVPVYRFLLTAAGNAYIDNVKNSTGMESYVEIFVPAIEEKYWEEETENPEDVAAF